MEEQKQYLGEPTQENKETQMSPDISKLAEALSKAQGEMENAAKDSENPYFRSKYSDLASVWNSLRKPLSSNGLAVIQIPETNDGRVTVTTLLTHSSGQWIKGTLSMRPVKDDPQGIGSCVTYARRYALSAITGLASEQDDDGNSASGLQKSPSMPKAKETSSKSESLELLVDLNNDAFGTKLLEDKKTGKKVLTIFAETGETLKTNDPKIIETIGKSKKDNEKVTLVHDGTNIISTK